MLFRDLQAQSLAQATEDSRTFWIELKHNSLNLFPINLYIFIFSSMQFSINKTIKLYVLKL